MSIVAAALMLLAPSAIDENRFRVIYRELVETNTVHDVGSCTNAARQIATRLAAAGYPAADLHRFAPEGHPEEGGLVATLPGRDPAAPAVLLLGHLDTVPARREDWDRDPFSLAEQNGYFIGRGTIDMKGLIAVWVDAMIELLEGPRPRRTVRLVLTCGEEGEGVNGLRWLIAQRPDLIRAGFALNEGGGGRLTPDGRPATLAFQILEKSYADFELTVTNAGGHSSLPRQDNAIVSLSRAIDRISATVFPARIDDTIRAFFRRSAPAASQPFANAMRTLAAKPEDAAAQSVLSSDPQYNAVMRTTCVVTRVSGGHANNALPQRATAVLNCRILPGETVAGTLKTLQRAVDDPAVTIAPKAGGTQESLAQPLPVALLRIAEAVAAEHFPGVPVIPTMAVAASDAPALIAAGVPTYGVPGIMTDADGGNMHGRNERVRVSALMQGRGYIRKLLNRYLEMP